MSTFASWVTQPISCNKCRIKLEALLCDEIRGTKYFSAIRYAGRWKENLPEKCPTGIDFIAGHVAGPSWTDALLFLDINLRDDIERVICHPLLITVACEEGVGYHCDLVFNPNNQGVEGDAERADGEVPRAR